MKEKNTYDGIMNEEIEDTDVCGGLNPSANVVAFPEWILVRNFFVTVVLP